MNYLNIFRNDYKFYRSPIRWIKTSLRNIKYAWQRAVRGYSDYDLYDLYGFYEHLFVESLRDFARKTCSYPGAAPFETPEKWESYVWEIAQHFYNSIESNEVFKNEWEDKYFANLGFERSGARIVDDLTPDEIHKNYYEREREIYKERDQERDLAFEMLKEVFGHLWI